MFSSLLRSRPAKHRRVVGGTVSRDPAVASPSSAGTPGRRHATADFTETNDDDEEDTQEDVMADFEAVDEDEDEHEDEDDEDHHGEPAGQRTPLPILPLFSSTHLGTSLSLTLWSEAPRKDA